LLFIIAKSSIKERQQLSLHLLLRRAADWGGGWLLRLKSTVAL